MVKTTVTFHLAFSLSHFPSGVEQMWAFWGNPVIEKVIWRNIRFMVWGDMLMKYDSQSLHR